jgi:hypothetical protein
LHSKNWDNLNSIKNIVEETVNFGHLDFRDLGVDILVQYSIVLSPY